MLQWYENVPAWVKVKANVPPGASVPLLKELVSEVTVCAVLSLLVQVTVVPTWT